MDKARGRAHLISFILLIVCMLGVMLPYANVPSVQAKEEKQPIENYVCSVHFIDVGQGDACFIELPNNKTVLIDGGNVEYGQKVAEYIKRLGYSEINCLIATHTDLDHIGGLNYILNAFEVECIFRPFVIASNVNYPEDDLTFINKNCEIIMTDDKHYAEFVSMAYAETYKGEPSKIYTLSNYANTLCSYLQGDASCPFIFEFLSPISEGMAFGTDTGRTTGYAINTNGVTDLNYLSAVSLLTIGKNGFIFMADATKGTEADIIEMANKEGNEELKKRLELTKVIKVAHHGSEDSTSSAFLELIQPSVAIVSVGATNAYGHPSSETMSRIEQYCTEEKIFRTDFSGNIVIRIGVSGALYAEVRVGKVDNGIPDWVFYLVFGITIGTIVVLSVLHIIRTKIRKDNGLETLNGEGFNNNPEEINMNGVTNNTNSYWQVDVEKPKEDVNKITKVSLNTYEENIDELKDNTKEDLKEPEIKDEVFPGGGEQFKYPAKRKGKVSKKVGEVNLIDVEDFFK